MLGLIFVVVHLVLILLQSFVRFVFGRTTLGVVTLSAIALPIIFLLWVLSSHTGDSPAVIVTAAVGVGWIIASVPILIGGCLVFAAMKDLSGGDAR
jgi:hypothetical protein